MNHTFRHIGLVLLLLPLVFSCNKEFPVPENEGGGSEYGNCFLFTKAGEANVDRVETYRVSDMYNGTTIDLLADGAYSGYYSPKGWLYPCNVDEDGNALDSEGNVILWDDPDWFTKTDKDSKYALRMRPLQNEEYAALVVCSPARRMQKYRVDEGHEGELVPYKTTLPKEAQVHWGYMLDRENDFYIADVDDKKYRFSVYDNQYIYHMPVQLKDLRAKISVVVACGSLEGAYLNSAHFQNVITDTWYRPKVHLYEYPVMDKGETDPYLAYTVNSYPSTGDVTTDEGNYFKVPVGGDAHIVQRPGKTGPFTEWSKSANLGTAITAIREFPVFSLDYSKRDGDRYVYEAQIPRIVVYSGVGGGLKTTVPLACNIEPMKKYTVIIYLSTATATAELYVTDWEDGATINGIGFGQYQSMEIAYGEEDPQWITDWETHNIPLDEGTIENPVIN